MTQTSNEQATKTPHGAVPPPVMYILYYRQGNNPHPQTKQFFLNSTDMKKVVERVKLHCERMNLRFVNVRPWLSDLDREENILLNRDSDQPEG